MIDEIKAQAGEIGVHLTDKQAEQLETFARLLMHENAKTNLTAITTPQEIISKHFIDSLTVLQAIPEDAHTLIDIGSGAGFPGIPLNIARPSLDITLLESVGKKAQFLKKSIELVALTHIQVENSRAEDAARTEALREHFDVATARAVARLPTLVEYALPFLKVGGILIAQKTADTDEKDSAHDALEKLEAKIQKIIPISLSDLPVRELIVIEKIAPTQDDYPRRAGVPLKRPL